MPVREPLTSISCLFPDQIIVSRTVITAAAPVSNLSLCLRHLVIVLAGTLLLLSSSPALALESAAEPKTTEQSESGPREIAVLEERSVLTPKGMLVLQPSLEFAHSTVNRVALEGFTILPSLTIGAIDVRKVDRNTVTAALALRYGLTRRLEIEAEVPYVWRQDSASTRPLEVGVTEDKITSMQSTDIGDIELRSRYQMNRGEGGWPFLVGDLRIKAPTGKGPFEVEIDSVTGLQQELPTGSGFWGIEPGITAIFPSDPAIFFVRSSYHHVIPRRVGTFGRIEPGGVFGLSFGMGFAINETASFSLGYEHSIVGKTIQNGEVVSGSDILHLGSLLLGASFRNSRNRSFHISLAAGLTDDATDVRLSLRYPISFSLSR